MIKNSTGTLSKPTIAKISAAVHTFLKAMQVDDFKVYVIIHEGVPVALIKAAPQKQLRYSSELEPKIQRYVAKHVELEEPLAVFWRFKAQAQTSAAVEYTDYETLSPSEFEARLHAIINNESLSPLSSEEIEVHEISMGEFKQFLQARPG